MVTTLTSDLWKRMIFDGAAMLEENRDTLNALNVFPVPDGDTGTNMSMTFMGAAREVAALPDGETSTEEILDAMRTGALRGARGNSGVILSQIVAGFPDACRRLKPETYTARCFVDALQRGKELAYEAVMRPKEGTMLSIIAAVADAGVSYVAKYEDFEGLMSYLLKAGQDALQKTPQQLPVLKEAGVVDAGGAGLLALLMGFQAAIDGKELDPGELIRLEKPVDFTNIGVCDRELEFGYCTEFFIKNIFPGIKESDVSKFRGRLSEIGDCVLVVGDTKLLKVHVHTNTPGTALNEALQLGELSRIKIDNMTEQHRELSDGAAVEPAEPADLRVVTVVSGEGFKDIFRDFQILDFVDGGQSMNPSAEDIARAIRAAHAKAVIVLPNNKNIILAAEQAGQLAEADVRVLRTTTLPQGIAAGIAYDPDADLAANAQAMEAAAGSVWTGLITHAVRDATLNGRGVRKGQIIGICDGEIQASGNSAETIVPELVESAPSGSDIFTVYYGVGVPEDSAKAVRDAIQKKYPDSDVDLLYGGQQVYDYVISAE